MFVSKIVRAPLQFLPESLALPILSGPARGMRWVVDSSVLRCWLGVYERDRLDQMKAMMEPGSVFYDVGAQAGYHTLHASRWVGNGGQVYAFEPLPSNFRNLARHVERNALHNVQPLQCAISDREGQMHFDPGPGMMAGHLSASGSLVVKAVSIDGFVEEGHRPPSFLKIDVEGAELRVLQGAEQTLRRYRPGLMLDTHDFLGGECAGLHNLCKDYLTGIGYGRLEHIAPDGFAGALIAYPQ